MYCPGLGIASGIHAVSWNITCVVMKIISRLQKVTQSFIQPM